MKKLRVFFRDTASGLPIHGLKISGEVYLHEDKQSPRVHPLGTLSTDINGYISYVWPCWALAMEKVVLRVADHPKLAFELGPKVQNWGTEVPLIVEVKEPAYAKLPGAYQFPAVQEPDRWDFQHTNLANSYTQLIFSGDTCGKMIPQHVQKECFELFHVIPSTVNPDNTVVLTSGADRLELIPADMIMSEICWDWLGYSMGRLVNTLSLAPCETLRFGIRNWRLDSEQYNESSSQEEFRESMIYNSMTSTMKELGIGLKVTPLSKGLPFNWPSLIGFVFKSVFGSNNLIDIGIKSQKRVMNSITRSVSRLKATHKIAVQRNSSSGSSSSTYRKLTNLNHCHSQTTNLFEVIDNYEVSSKMKERRKAVLIKYPNSAFTKQKIFCNRHLFAGNLLDPALEDCLNSIGKVASCCEPEEGDGDCIRISTLKVSFTIGKNATGSLIKLALRINGVVQYFLVGSPKYNKGETHSKTIELGEKYCITDITEVGLQNDPDNVTDGAFNISSMGISYTSPQFQGEKPFFSHGPHGEVNRNETDFLGKPTPWTPPVEEEEVSCQEEEICCSEQLLVHFNCNKLYYNQILWQNENPHERLARFFGFEYLGAPLAQQIVNEPVAFWGHYVAFELSGTNPVVLNPCFVESEIVSLPTGGLFSETLLGQCNSCEDVDLEVLENHTNHPCGCSGESSEAGGE